MKRQKPRTLPIGQISEATLRMEDLIPALLWDLKRLRLTRQERSIVNTVAAAAEQDEDREYWQETAHEDYEDLCTIAEAHCPDYAYFGSTDGDGACIGVWPIMPDENDEDVFRMSAGNEFSSVPGVFGYVLSVTDHGNCTLYRRTGTRWIEVWAVV